RDRQRVDLEEEQTLGLRQLLQDRVQARTWIPGARRDRKSGLRQHALWILPCREVAELVGADQEQRILPAARTQRVHGAFVLVAQDVIVGKGSANEPEPRVRVELDVLVPGPHG